MQRDLKTTILFISLISVGIIKAQALQKTLLKAIQKGDVTEVHDLIKEGAKVNVEKGTPPLVLAAQLAKTKIDDSKMAVITGELLHNKANPTIQDRFGMTPLMWAAKNGANKVLKALLENREASGTIDMQDRQGNTALILATMAASTGESDDYLEVVRTLLMRRANRVITNNGGKTAFFYAEKTGNVKMINIFYLR